MANIKSAKKRARQTQKRRLHNAMLRRRTMTQLKQARSAIAACQDDKVTPSEEQLNSAKQATQSAISLVDRLVPKAIFHKNKAARFKRQLHAGLKAINA